MKDAMTLSWFLKQWRNPVYKKQLVEWQHKAFYSPRLYEYLAWLYDDLSGGNLLKTENYIFPSAFFPVGNRQKDLPESILGEFIERSELQVSNHGPHPLNPPLLEGEGDFLLPSPSRREAGGEVRVPPKNSSKKPTLLHIDLPNAFHEPGKLYLEKLQADSPTLWNGRTFSMEKIRMDKNDALKIDCTNGTYFDALQSCDLLEFELLTFFGKFMPAPKDFPEFTQLLKLREALHAHGNPLLSSCGRSAAIGISVLIIFRKGDEDYILLRTCSPKVAANIRLWHAVPSLMMQPVSGPSSQEYSILHNIYREYLEEIFDFPEADNAEDLPYDYFYDDPNLKYLQKLLEEGEAQLHLTGIAMDLLKLRPEVCTVLRITSPEWIERHTTGTNFAPIAGLSWPVTEELSPKKTKSRLIAVRMSDFKENLRSYFQPVFFSPPGAVACWTAIDQKFYF